jgi:hypothetical protein
MRRAQLPARSQEALAWAQRGIRGDPRLREFGADRLRAASMLDEGVRARAAGSRLARVLCPQASASRSTQGKNDALPRSRPQRAVSHSPGAGPWLPC